MGLWCYLKRCAGIEHKPRPYKSRQLKNGFCGLKECDWKQYLTRVIGSVELEQRIFQTRKSIDFLYENK